MENLWKILMISIVVGVILYQLWKRMCKEKQYTRDFDNNLKKQIKDRQNENKTS
ncbi:hypothetical protein HN803_07660 [candidate division WWE3 bacterium]|nr:hypothetical protein [candidate division WWE3 bacterium]